MVVSDPYTGSGASPGAKRSQVVEAHHVIRMGMREYRGIDPAHILAAGIASESPAPYR